MRPSLPSVPGDHIDRLAASFEPRREAETTALRTQGFTPERGRKLRGIEVGAEVHCGLRRDPVEHGAAPANEDRELERAFRRACDGENAHRQRLPFDIVITDKRANSVGLQLADLIARPVGLKVLRPHQANRAFDLIREKFMREKFMRHPTDGNEDWGFRCFP
jgi:hypothetical protein